MADDRSISAIAASEVAEMKAVDRQSTVAIAVLLDPPGRLIDVVRLQAACRKAEGNGFRVGIDAVTITREASGVVVRGRLKTVNAIQAAFLDPQSNLRRQFTNLTPEEEGEMNVRRAFDGMMGIGYYDSARAARPKKKDTTKPVPVAPTPQRRKIRLED